MLYEVITYPDAPATGLWSTPEPYGWHEVTVGQSPLAHAENQADA